RSTCGSPTRIACHWPIHGGRERCRLFTSIARCDLRHGTAAAGSCCNACGTSTSTTSIPTASTTSTTSVPTTTSTSSTSSTTSTTTSTSTSSTTLIPCGGIFPICTGSCPPGQECTAATIASPCACAPIAP